MKNRLKRMLSMVLIIIMLVSLFPSGIWAEENFQGNAGKNSIQEIASMQETKLGLDKINPSPKTTDHLDLEALEKEQTSTKAESIQTTAIEGDYEYAVVEGGITITKYKGAGGNVTIPGTLGGLLVTSIGSSAFYDCSSLTSISLPESLTSIRDGAFSRCTGLTSIDLPESLTSVGEYAFASCTSLTNIILPESLVSIGDGAFSWCFSLTSISLSKNQTHIGDHVFNDCSSLTSIGLPENLTSIGDNAFSGCTGLMSIDLPENLTSIGNGAFRDCYSLTRISMPESLTSIGDGAFSWCTDLTSIDLPESLTSIGDDAFHWCTGLTSIDLPESLTSIGDDAFFNCSSLTSISLPESLNSIGGGAFKYCDSLKSIQFNSAKTLIGDGTITIPTTTTVIGYDPSTAKDYAVKWGNHFEVLESPETMKISNDERHSFTNDFEPFFGTDPTLKTEWSVSKKDYNSKYNYKLNNPAYQAKLLKDTVLPSPWTAYMLFRQNQKWGGSCFGMSAAMVSSKLGKIDITNMDVSNFKSNTKIYHELKSPFLAPEVKDLANYYQIAQYLPIFQLLQNTCTVNTGDTTFSSIYFGVDMRSFLDKLVERSNLVDDQGPILLNLIWTKGSHSVVVNGCKELGNGKFQLDIIDPNYSTNTKMIITLTKDEASFVFKDNSGNDIYIENSWIGSWKGLSFYNSYLILDYLDFDGPFNITGAMSSNSESSMTEDATIFYLENGNDATIVNDEGQSCTINDWNLTGELVPEQMNFIVNGIDTPATLAVALPQNETFRVKPLSDSVDVSLVDGTRFAAVTATGLSEVEFSSNNSVKMNGSGISYEAFVPSQSDEGIIGVSDEDGGNVSIEPQADGIKISSENMNNLEVTSLTFDDASALTVETDKSEIMIKDKSADETGVVEIYVSENNDGNFGIKIGESSAEGNSDPGDIDDPDTPGQPGFKAFLGQTTAGEYYEYNAAELNNAYLAYQINPALSSAKMYQQFLDSGCEVVALKDGAKGYLDYNGAATASLLAQIQGTAFDINTYLGSGSAAVYGGVVSNVRVVNVDGSLIH